MRTLLILTGLLFINLHAVAQEKSEKKLDHSVREWEVYKSDQNCLIEYRFADCEASIGYDKEIIQFRISNTSSEKIQLDWHMYLFYNGVCKTCDYPQEYKYELTLEPNQIVSGDCALGSDHRLTIFSKFNDPKYTGGSQLTDFDFHNLTITTIH